MPDLGGFFSSPKGIYIIMWPARLTLVDKPIFRQCLARDEFQLLPRLATNSDFRETAEILTHIQYKDRILTDGVLHAKALHDFYRFGYLLAQCTARSLLNDHGFPASIAA